MNRIVFVYNHIGNQTALVMKKNKTLLLLLTLGISLVACNDKNEEVMGYAPIYPDDQQTTAIQLLAPQPILKAGKIYVLGHTLYQVEQDAGIHVLDITNSAEPKKLGFIPVAGAQEISIKDQLLYTNHYNDLLVLDISSLEDIKILNRVPNTFKLQNGLLPPERGYFDCPDPEKGSVIGWEKKLLHNPHCHY